MKQMVRIVPEVFFQKHPVIHNDADEVDPLKLLLIAARRKKEPRNKKWRKEKTEGRTIKNVIEQISIH
jgi:hypothetical protein